MLAATVVLAALLAATPAAPAASRDNVVEVELQRPASDEIALAHTRIEMADEDGGRATGRLPVRRVRGIPDGFGVAAVRAGRDGDTVTVRIAAVRTGADSHRGRPLRVRLRVGKPRHTYKRAVTSRVMIAPGQRVRRHPGCGAINGEAEGWKPVRRLRTIRFGARRFGAMTSVGAATELACGRIIESITGTDRFLIAVDREFLRRGPAVEGFYATWAREPDGSPRICVYVRGRAGRSGEVTLAGSTQGFRLDTVRGVGRVDAVVPGEGEYPFTVRWRQPDGTLRESESTLTVPASEPKGGDPEEPYSSAGNCG